MKLQPGDVFLTSNPMALSRAINWAQRIWNKDSKSKYSHAGILTDANGATFEAIWTVKSQNLFDAYEGDQVLIARHESMAHERFLEGFNPLYKEQNGKIYPFYRLIFHIIPPLAKLSIGKLVCSELVAKFLKNVGLMDYYNGCNPDNLHDVVRWHKGWKIIFEGILPAGKDEGQKA